MTLEQRIDRLEGNVGRLAVVQDQMMDLLGLSLEGERRLATRVERIEESDAKLRDTVNEIGDRLNALIAVVNDVVRGKR